MNARDLLVIDPCMTTAESDAYGLLSDIVDELATHLPKFTIRRLKFCLPVRGARTLESLLAEGGTPGAVVSLGSYANLSDTHAWVPPLLAPLEDGLLARGVPFFGICFSHQLLAHARGAGVRYVRDRFQRKVKWEGAREIHVSDPRLRLLLARVELADLSARTERARAFAEVVGLTRAWDVRQWRCVWNTPVGHLSRPESRVRAFVEEACSPSFLSWARHEQEVATIGGLGRGPLAFGPEQDAFHVAATSPHCAIEALVHARHPAYTFQSHPEVALASPHDGRLVLRNFLLVAHWRASV
jgi:GMP synthase-like glutamine amidotransferase